MGNFADRTLKDYTWILTGKVTGTVILAGAPNETVVVTDGTRRAMLRLMSDGDTLHIDGLDIEMSASDKDEFCGVMAQIERRGWSEPG